MEWTIRRATLTPFLCVITLSTLLVMSGCFRDEGLVDTEQARVEIDRFMNETFKECKKGRRFVLHEGTLLDLEGLSWEIEAEDLTGVHKKTLRGVTFRGSIKLRGLGDNEPVSFRVYNKQENKWGRLQETVFIQSKSTLPRSIEVVKDKGEWNFTAPFAAPDTIPCDAIRNNKPLASYIPSPPKVQEAQDQSQDVEAEGQAAAAATPDPYAFAEEGAKTFARKFKEENFTKCKDRYYTQEVTFPKMDAGKDRIYELESLPNMEVKMVPKEWTERYRLRDDHSDSFYGRIFIRSTSVKVCTDSCRPLSDNYIVVPIVFKFGEWQVEGGDRFKGVSCDELPLAQSN